MAFFITLLCSASDLVAFGASSWRSSVEFYVTLLRKCFAVMIPGIAKPKAFVLQLVGASRNVCHCSLGK